MSLIPTGPPAPDLNKPAVNKTTDESNTPPSLKFRSLKVVEYQNIFDLMRENKSIKIFKALMNGHSFCVLCKKAAFLQKKVSKPDKSFPASEVQPSCTISICLGK